MIRVGIGGWTFEPWRGVFYPPKWPQARELHHASRHVTAIEINGTFYGSQKPASFRKWHDETPDDFIFSLKGPRFTVNRKELATAGESVGRFIASGVTELKTKLGPILWQLPPTKRFDPDDIAAFLALLPREADGLRLRHALEVRHDSFKDARLVDMLRAANVALVFAESDKYPAIGDATADFVYARLQRTREDIPTGYADADLARIAGWATAWERGETPAGLPIVAAPATRQPRDVFIFMISGAKVRAPAAAMALLQRLRA